MIPKILHFCWFGDQPYPEVVQRCLDSWSERLPDFTIMRWDESNAPIDLPYIADALADRNWAFASDAARVEVLREHGGVYLDTDMLVVGDFEQFLEHGVFVGAESDEFVNAAIVGARPGHPVIEALCEHYRATAYDSQSLETIPRVITGVLGGYGLAPGAEISRIVDPESGDICVYPAAHFYPFPWEASARRDVDPESFATTETVAIHLWNMSWIPWSRRVVGPYIDGENYDDAWRVLTARWKRQPLQGPTFYRLLLTVIRGKVQQRRR